MQIALRDVTLYQAGFSSLRQGLQDLGLTAVELAVTRRLTLPAPEDSLGPGLPATTPEQQAEISRVYRAAGLTPCALFLANNFNALDPAAEIAWGLATVRLAESLGVPVVRLDGAMSGPDHLTRRRRLALYGGAVTSLLEATAGSSVALAIENHGRQGNDLPWLESLLADLDPARVGLTLDPANLYWAGYPLAEVYEATERLAPRVRHVHVKNLCYPEAVRETRRPLGWEYGCCVCPTPEGDLDYGRLVAILAAAGYAGALALEEESLGKYPPAERPALLARDVTYLQQAGGTV
ncbi:MAG TPA: TIM barrel protein [Armatimonadota bacterium]|jgi:sugar phosphate isomerase/epimerase